MCIIRRFWNKLTTRIILCKFVTCKYRFNCAFKTEVHFYFRGPVSHILIFKSYLYMCMYKRAILHVLKQSI